MPEKKGLFSVVVPCYNQGHYLAQAVQSVLAQTYANWQLIIVDDGATDDSAQVADYWAARDERISVIHQANAGLPAARNAGIAAATGEYICFLDADDCLLPAFMQHMVQAMQSGADWVVGGYTYFNDEGTLKKDVLIQALPADILHKNIAPPVAFAMRYAALAKTGWFDTSYHTAEDWDFWIRCYKAGLVWQCIPSVLVKYRVVPNSMSRNALKMYEGFVKAAQQALVFDNRINVSGPLNRNYPEWSAAGSIQHSLATCLGLMIIQGKHQEAVALYQRETNKWGLLWQPAHFAPMCSFLSFRYQTSKTDLQRVVRQYKPAFEKFLQETDLNTDEQLAALKAITGMHEKLYARAKWGVLAKVAQKIKKV